MDAVFGSNCIPLLVVSFTLQHRQAVVRRDCQKRTSMEIAIVVIEDLLGDTVEAKAAWGIRVVAAGHMHKNSSGRYRQSGSTGYDPSYRSRWKWRQVDDVCAREFKAQFVTTPPQVCVCFPRAQDWLHNGARRLGSRKMRFHLADQFSRVQSE